MNERTTASWDLAFRISVRWPIYIINSVDKTKFLKTHRPRPEVSRNKSCHSSAIGCCLEKKTMLKFCVSIEHCDRLSLMTDTWWWLSEQRRQLKFRLILPRTLTMRISKQFCNQVLKVSVINDSLSQQCSHKILTLCLFLQATANAWTMEFHTMENKQIKQLP